MPDLFVRGPLRCTMGSVAITLRIMPDNPETDLEAIKSRVRGTLAGALHDLREDRQSTRLNSSHIQKSRMPSSA